MQPLWLSKSFKTRRGMESNTERKTTATRANYFLAKITNKTTKIAFTLYITVAKDVMNVCFLFFLNREQKHSYEK